MYTYIYLYIYYCIYTLFYEEFYGPYSLYTYKFIPYHICYFIYILLRVINILFLVIS